MSLADELYRETILDHYHHPRHRGIIADATVKAEGINPLCGDELTLYLKIEGDNIKDIKLEAKGCSINTASGSIMSELVNGRSLAEAGRVANIFKDMMLIKTDSAKLSDDLEELEALQGVKKYPVRIKCALLPWNTLLEGIDRAKEQANNGEHQ